MSNHFENRHQSVSQRQLCSRSLPLPLLLLLSSRVVEQSGRSRNEKRSGTHSNNRSAKTHTHSSRHTLTRLVLLTTAFFLCARDGEAGKERQKHRRETEAREAGRERERRDRIAFSSRDTGTESGAESRTHMPAIVSQDDAEGKGREKRVILT